ncbi:MAG TPA: DUF1524 domain-containing protein [Bacteriovoracaceae bacterium]|nr:DUF1524 domain-containing protein [Bacteriovoracaceae bacterium]
MYLLLALFLSFSSCSSTEVYKRKEWHSRWIDEDKDCQNTRAEVLIERSLVPVTFTNKKKCTVKSGKWNDYYFPTVLTQAKDIDIDHLVPLYEAHKSGGAQWPKDKKVKFANDPENLVITHKVTNRKKGANTLKTWLPLHYEYACRYYHQWMYIKKKYDLKISSDEVNSLDISKCPAK